MYFILLLVTSLWFHLILLWLVELALLIFLCLVTIRLSFLDGKILIFFNYVFMSSVLSGSLLGTSRIFQWKRFVSISVIQSSYISLLGFRIFLYFNLVLNGLIIQYHYTHTKIFNV